MASNNSLKNKRILITCGPTWIPIDDTRIISNISTGRLGELVTNEIAKTKAKITLLEGPVTKRRTSKTIRVIKFHYYDEFFRMIKKELKKRYDIIIHAAAVSDYKLRKPYSRKLSSNYKTLTLRLVQTHKIINLIKRLSPKSILVGFKLRSRITKKSALEKTQRLFDHDHCDLVVANSTSNEAYNGFIINRQRQFLAQKKSRASIAKALVNILRKTES